MSKKDRDAESGSLNYGLEDIKMHLELDRATPTHIEFWEAVLKRLQIYKAKARLKEIYAGLLRQHLWQLQESDSNEHQISKEEVSCGADNKKTPALFISLTNRSDTG